MSGQLQRKHKAYYTRVLSILGAGHQSAITVFKRKEEAKGDGKIEEPIRSCYRTFSSESEHLPLEEGGIRHQ